MKPARSLAGAVLLALALPTAALAAAPFDFPLQFPSATTQHSLPSALRPALERAIVADPDAVWLETKILAADGQADDLFGFRVLVAGDTAFVSAPAPIYRPGKVYVFENSGGGWTATQTISATPTSAPPPGWSDFFGWSLSLSGDTLLVGAPFMLDPMAGPIGAVYAFTNDGGTWTQTQELTASDAAATDYFGWSVKHVGDTAVVGSNSHNRGANGTEGAAYVFTRSGGTWTQTQELEGSDSTPGDGRQFGSAIAFDGTTLLIGAPSSDWNSTGVYIPGAVYVFANSGGTWAETERLVPGDSADGDQFGYSVALDGANAVIGAPAANIGKNSHQGAIYAFDGSSGSWTELVKLVADDGVAYDQLGQSVAIDGDMALAGSWSHNDDPEGTPPPPKPGVAYLYTASHGTWNFSTKFTASDGSDGDSFGWDVAIDGTTLVVGSQGTVGGNEFQGAAYIYAPGEPPVADVAPTSLDFSLASGASGTATLSISNRGGSALDYTIFEGGEDCSASADIPWLAEAPESGTVASGASQDVTVTASADGLDPGSYAALVCVTTNDPDHGLIGVPASLTVTADDTIFVDGFDGAP
ncbi:MAG TPA: hypothetical protein VHE32_10975 [Rhodanobacteraceae bacterium]|nr:hypothetical protein [Rhodanobacteraceae bacterium]